jgi:hypothetical protein
MGFNQCILFDCGRDALRAYMKESQWGISLPENICPTVHDVVKNRVRLLPINQNTGLTDSAPVHLYGYQAYNEDPYSHDVALDPLMTGWLRHLKNESAIISFGHKKMLSLGYGGAFLTNDSSLAQSMARSGRWNECYTQPLLKKLREFPESIEWRREVIDLWDRHLGDALIRIPREQIMPWRVMRRAVNRGQRDNIVELLRNEGIDVGVNYPPITSYNQWGDTVLNFFSTESYQPAIKKACEIIRGAIAHG